MHSVEEKFYFHQQNSRDSTDAPSVDRFLLQKLFWKGLRRPFFQNVSWFCGFELL